jgi:multidrug resistance protein, MATE family
MAPTSSRPIPTLERIASSYSRSFSAQSPIAQASISRDIDEYSGDDAESSSGEEDESEQTLVPSTSVSSGQNYSMASSYRRLSFTIAGPRATMMPHSSDRERLSKVERERAIEEERSLLRDNNVIPPKHPQEGEGRRKSIFGSVLKVPGGDKKVVSPEQAPSGAEGGAAVDIDETTALLGDPQLPYGGQDSPENIAQKWEEAVKEGKIQTTWQREAKVLGGYAWPLMITFVLQYSLTVASIFTVGHLGKAELGAVSLASMSANITGYAVYQGLATSLDTLCAQAYGSGRRKLVGLQMQRMIYFLWALTIPIGIIWICAEQILLVIVPEPAVARLAGLYLKVVLAGAPGYACFESGKRFVQAQGLFSASLYVLIFCAPFNAFLNWFFVWVRK